MKGDSNERGTHTTKRRALGLPFTDRKDPKWHTHEIESERGLVREPVEDLLHGGELALGLLDHVMEIVEVGVGVGGAWAGAQAAAAAAPHGQGGPVRVDVLPVVVVEVEQPPGPVQVQVLRVGFAQVLEFLRGGEGGS